MLEIYTHRCKTDEPKNAMKISNIQYHFIIIICMSMCYPWTIWNLLCLNRNSHALNHHLKNPLEIDSGYWWWSVYELLISMFLYESSIFERLNHLNCFYARMNLCYHIYICAPLSVYMEQVFVELFYQFLLYQHLIQQKKTINAISFFEIWCEAGALLLRTSLDNENI